jgi:translation initiation factor IF-3
VRLIDEKGAQLGILPLGAALERAQARGFDLVEVAADAKPPVCRIMDYTKYVYELKRKQKMAKKKGHRQETKELKLRPNIDPHDFGIKLKHAREFLEKGDKVKLTIRYRPREMRHFEIGTQILNRLIEESKDLATVESQNRGGEGIRMQVAILAPRKVPQGVVKEDEA